MLSTKKDKAARFKSKHVCFGSIHPLAALEQTTLETVCEFQADGDKESSRLMEGNKQPLIGGFPLQLRGGTKNEQMNK